jgi:hypothetical protein
VRVCACADSTLLCQALASATPMPSHPIHGTVSTEIKGLPLPLAHTAPRQPSSSSKRRLLPYFSSPFTPSPLASPSSLHCASFAGHGGAPHRGVPHHTAGAASRSPDLTRAIVAPPQPPVNHPRLLPPLFGASSSSRSCQASAP